MASALTFTDGFLRRLMTLTKDEWLQVNQMLDAIAEDPSVDRVTKFRVKEAPTPFNAYV